MPILAASSGALINITTARIARQINVPIGSLASKVHFQGVGWAKDPNTGAELFFQMQAQPTSKGDVEDLYVHSYSLVGDTLTYQDTMVGRGFGHCQTVKVRISAAGNPALWLGLVTYDAKGNSVGQKVFKIMYRKGEVTRPGLTPIYTGSGNYVTPVDCPDWTIVLRRPSGDQEHYEWYDERELFAATEKSPAKYKRRLTVPKVDTFQSACATGTFDAPGGIFRLNGAATDTPQWLTQFCADGGPTVQLETTNILSGSGGGTVEEPEAVLTVRDELWVGKQTSPYTSGRIVAYMPLSLS